MPHARLVSWLALLLLAGCSVRKIALRSVADALSSSSTSSFAQDEDLGLVGDAVPFALKLMESIAQELPEHQGLRLSLASGFTQYGMVWVQWPAEQRKYEDFAAYKAGLDRARAFFLRARSHALQGMELAHPGFSERLASSPERALEGCDAADVPQLYWLSASWLAAISNAREDPEMIGQLPTVAVLVRGALALDEDWDRGAIHELLISLEPALPPAGGAERARQHFARAVELSGGLRASPYVSLATGVEIDAQDRAAFQRLLEQALAVDPTARPEERLASEYSRAKARFLLDHLDDLFI